MVSKDDSSVRSASRSHSRTLSTTTDSRSVSAHEEQIRDLIQNIVSAADEVTNANVDDWIDVNFSSFEEVKSTVQDNLLNGALSMPLNSILRETESFDVSTFDKDFWMRLTKDDCQPAKVACILWITMEAALLKDSSLVQVRCGCAAASVYTRLCTVAGATVFKFFYPELIQKAIEVWRLCFRVLIFGARTVDELTEKTKKKGKKSKLNTTVDVSHDTLPRSDMLDVIDTSTISLYMVLRKVALSGMDSCAIAVARYVGDIARIDYDKRDPRTTAVDSLDEFKKRKLFVERSFALAHLLAHGRHSPDASLVYERIVQPRLLLWSWENVPFTGGAMPMAIQHFSDAVQNFVKDRAAIANDEELETIFELLYTLLAKCPDRAEYRAKVPRTIVNLLKLLPRLNIYEYRTLVPQFTKANTVAIALEVATIMISEFDWTGQEPINPDRYKDTTVQQQQKKKKGKKNTTTNAEDEGIEEDAEMESDDGDDMSDEEGGKKNKAEKQPPKKLTQKEKEQEIRKSFPTGAKLLFRMIVDCVAHNSSALRSRSMQIVAHLLLQNDANLLAVEEAAKEFLALSSSIFLGETGDQSKNASGVNEVLMVQQQNDATLGRSQFFPLLECNSRDAKSQVRKSTCLCVEKFLVSAGDNEFQVGLNMMQKFCRDEAQVVRKQAAESITTLLNAVEPNSEKWHKVTEIWISDVFPMIGDADNGVAEMVAGLVLELVLTPLLSATKTVDGLAAEVLHRVYPGSGSRTDLIRALKDQASHRHLKPSVMHDLIGRLEKNPVNEDDLWTLLDCLIRVFPNSAVPDFALRRWKSFARPPMAQPIRDWSPLPTVPYGNTSRALLGMMRLLRDKMKDEEKRWLCDNLKGHLQAQTVPSQLINEVWITLAALLGHQRDGEKAECTELKEFAAELYRSAATVIKSIWYEEKYFLSMDWLKKKTAKHGNTFLARMVLSTAFSAQFNLDVIYQLDRDEIDVREPLMISYLLKMTTKCFSDLRDNLGRKRKDVKFGDAKNPYGDPARKNGRWAADVEWMRMRRAHSDVTVLFPPKEFPIQVRSAAALSLGAHCIYDGELARDFLPELIKEMHGSGSAHIRTNLMVPCCDMVKRYAVAEQLAPALATMLLDPHPFVRCQALEMITHLIKEQFIKWEGLIMHLYVILCIDEHAQTAKFAQEALKCALLPLMEDMLYTNFMEFILFYNNAPYTWSTNGGLEPTQRKKIRVCSGSEASQFVWRQTILRFILSTFNDQQRFGAMVRMSADVLQVAAKGTSLNIRDPTVAALCTDCLELMSCEEMEISYDLGKKAGDGDVAVQEDDEPTDAVQVKAKEAVMQVYRKGLQQRILPVLFDLLGVAEKVRLGSLARRITFTIEMLCKDHVEFLEEMLKALNPERAPELLTEIKRPNGFVQQELLRRRKDKEDQRHADVNDILIADHQEQMRLQPATPKVKRITESRLARMDETGESRRPHSVTMAMPIRMVDPSDNEEEDDGDDEEMGTKVVRIRRAKDDEERARIEEDLRNRRNTMARKHSDAEKRKSIREEGVRFVLDACSADEEMSDDAASSQKPAVAVGADAMETDTNPAPATNDGGSNQTNVGEETQVTGAQADVDELMKGISPKKVKLEVIETEEVQEQLTVTAAVLTGENSEGGTSAEGAEADNESVSMRKGDGKRGARRRANAGKEPKIEVEDEEMEVDQAPVAAEKENAQQGEISSGNGAQSGDGSKLSTAPIGKSSRSARSAKSDTVSSSLRNLSVVHEEVGESTPARLAGAKQQKLPEVKVEAVSPTSSRKAQNLPPLKERRRQDKENTNTDAVELTAARNTRAASQMSVAPRGQSRAFSVPPTPMSTVAPVDETLLEGRMCSTPKKDMKMDLTFAGIDISRIEK